MRTSGVRTTAFGTIRRSLDDDAKGNRKNDPRDDGRAQRGVRDLPDGIRSREKEKRRQQTLRGLTQKSGRINIYSVWRNIAFLRGSTWDTCDTIRELF